MKDLHWRSFAIDDRRSRTLSWSVVSSPSQFYRWLCLSQHNIWNSLTHCHPWDREQIASKMIIFIRNLVYPRSLLCHAMYLQGVTMTMTMTMTMTSLSTSLKWKTVFHNSKLYKIEFTFPELSLQSLKTSMVARNTMERIAHNVCLPVTIIWNIARIANAVQCHN